MMLKFIDYCMWSLFVGFYIAAMLSLCAMFISLAIY